MSQLNQLLYIPKHLKDDFERNRSSTNLNRIIPIAIFLYGFEWVIFYFQDYVFNVGHLILPLQIVSTFIILMMLYIRNNMSRFSNYFINFVIGLYVFSLSVFSIFLTLSLKAQIDLMYVHIMIMMGLISILYFKPWESFVFLFSFGTIIILLLPNFQPIPEVVLVHQMNLLIFDTIIWLFSLNLYLQQINTFSLQHDLVIKNQELEHLVKTDSMTNLFNHKAILELLSEEMQRSERNEQALSIILLDIDDFKRINDQFGHQVGDEVLISLSKIIKHSLRSIDRVGRYGGEEFLILLPNTNLNAGRLYALRLQSLIRNYKLPNDGHLTLSGGLAEYTGESIDELIKQADQLLYQAKKSGKDQIISQ